ncbi:MAG: type II toxin-antitoxin system VapC family toxin [Chloroflexota bacterium]
MIVFDTHTWWWAISDQASLSTKARQLIADTPSGQHCIASISIWEFSMMAKRDRIRLHTTPEEWLRIAIEDANIQVLPLSPEIALESCNLPGEFHKDPADQIIVATARIYNVPLVTKDGKIRKYEHVKTVW